VETVDLDSFLAELGARWPSSSWRSTAPRSRSSSGCSRQAASPRSSTLRMRCTTGSPGIRGARRRPMRAGLTD